MDTHYKRIRTSHNSSEHIKNREIQFLTHRNIFLGCTEIEVDKCRK